MTTDRVSAEEIPEEQESEVEGVESEVEEGAGEEEPRYSVTERVGEVAGAGLSRVADELRLEPPPEEEEDELAHLFETPQPDDNDMRTDDLFELPDEEENDISDLVDVSYEDMMGGEERPISPRRRAIRKIRRVSGKYIPPSSSMGSIRP